MMEDYREASERMGYEKNTKKRRIRQGAVMQMGVCLCWGDGGESRAVAAEWLGAPSRHGCRLLARAPIHG